MSLKKIYEQTNYEVYPSSWGAGFIINIGKTSDLLEQLLEEKKVESWAFITAENPGSKHLPNTENQRLTLRLIAEIERMQLQYLKGEGVGDREVWKPEESFLILGISRPQSEELAKKFKQQAFVFGKKSEPAKLVWIK